MAFADIPFFVSVKISDSYITGEYTSADSGGETVGMLGNSGPYTLTITTLFDGKVDIFADETKEWNFQVKKNSGDSIETLNAYSRFSDKIDTIIQNEASQIVRVMEFRKTSDTSDTFAGTATIINSSDIDMQYEVTV